MHHLRKQSGQAATSEYTVTVLIVIMVIVGMTAFIQRLLQGRIKASRDYMIEHVSVAHGNTIEKEYEPYYGHVISNVERRSINRSQLNEGGLTGIYQKQIDETNQVESVITQAPPKDAF